MAHCLRHYEEPIAALCRTCGQPFCSRCLVFAFGPKKPPYCVGCALTASGVRVAKNAPVAKADPDVVVPQDKRVERAQRRAEKAAARSMAKPSRLLRRNAPPEPPAPIGQDLAPRPSYVPAPSGAKANSAHPV